MNDNMLVSARRGRQRGLCARYALNLRPEAGSEGTVLRVAGAPAVLTEATDWAPIAVDGKTLILKRGRELGLLSTESGAPADVTVLATLSSEPTAVHIAGNRMIAMTADGPWLFVRAGADAPWTSAGHLPKFPAINIEARDYSLVTATVADCDTTTVGAACVAAYTSMAAQANASGALMQPVMARVRLFDDSGNIIHTSEPVAVMLPGPVPFAEATTFECESNDGTTVKVRTKELTAPTYRLHVSVFDELPDPWRELIALAEVQVTPQFHLLGEGDAEVSVSRGAPEGTQRTVRVMMPQSPLSFGCSATATTAMRAVAEHFDALARTVATVHNPYAAAQSMDVAVADTLLPIEHNRKILKVVGEAVDHTPYAIARLDEPGGFTAGHVAASGAAVAWAALGLIRRPAPSPAWWAVQTTDRRWTADVLVDFANGDCVVASYSGAQAPVLLSPIVSYPTPDAESITITMNVDGDVHTCTLPLTPDATGHHSVFVATTAAPFAIDGEAVEIDPGDHYAPVVTLPMAVAVATAGHCLKISSVANAGATVNALVAARNTGGAWDFGRARFWVFTPAGICMAVAANSLQQMSMTRVDSRCVAGPECVADAGAVVYALAGGALLELAGGRVNTAAVAVSGNRLGWIDADAEVVVADTDNNEATHFCTLLGMDTYNTTLVARGPWLSAAGTVYAVTENGLCDLGKRTAAAQTSVRWQAAVADLPVRRRRLAALIWPVKASRFTGTLTVSRRWLTELSPVPAVMARMAVDGVVRAPLRCPVVGHPAADVWLDVSASVSADFAITVPETVFTTSKIPGHAD